jgi:pimeloyl-ACP methyl ester carboxylesterase
MPFDAHGFGHALWRNRRRLLQRNTAGLSGEFVRVPGAQLRVLDVRRPGASAATLVLVPDPPNLIEHYRPLIETFSPQMRVVCFELPGFGHSYTEPGFRFDIPGQALALDALFQTLDIREAVLDMSCLGAYIGLALAQARPHRVRHLMLQQVPAFAETQAWARRADVWGLIRTPWVGQALMRAIYRKVAHHWYHAALPPGHDAATHAHYAEPTLHALAGGACFCLADAYQSLLRQTPLRWDGMNAATTAVWGGADTTHSHTSPQSLRHDLPHTAFVEFADCGHFPALEAPERYFPLLQAACAPAL